MGVQEIVPGGKTVEDLVVNADVDVIPPEDVEATDAVENIQGDDAQFYVLAFMHHPEGSNLDSTEDSRSIIESIFSLASDVANSVHSEIDPTNAITSDSTRMLDSECYRFVIESDDESMNSAWINDSFDRKFHKRTRVVDPVVGKRRARRLENDYLLKFLGGEDEDEGISISSGFKFSKVFKFFENRRDVLKSFIDCPLDEDVPVGKQENSEMKREKGKKSKSNESDEDDEIFQDFLTFSLELVRRLDTSVFKFFTGKPSGTYISRPLSRHERFILHRICNYYGLNSESFYNNNMRRLIKATNDTEKFSAEVSLFARLQEIIDLESDSKEFEFYGAVPPLI